MRSKFDEQLSLLNRELIQMGALCEEAISLAAKALAEGDKTLAEKVGRLEAEIVLTMLPGGYVPEDVGHICEMGHFRRHRGAQGSGAVICRGGIGGHPRHWAARSARLIRFPGQCPEGLPFLFRRQPAKKRDARRAAGGHLALYKCVAGRSGS